jgi:hypothetical protein
VPICQNCSIGKVTAQAFPEFEQVPGGRWLNCANTALSIPGSEHSLSRGACNSRVRLSVLQVQAAANPMHSRQAAEYSSVSAMPISRRKSLLMPKKPADRGFLSIDLKSRLPDY